MKVSVLTQTTYGVWR